MRAASTPNGLGEFPVGPSHAGWYPLPRQPGPLLPVKSGGPMVGCWVSPWQGRARHVRQESEMGTCSRVFQLSLSLWRKHGISSELGSCMQSDLLLSPLPFSPFISRLSFLSRSAELKQAAFQFHCVSHRILCCPLFCGVWIEFILLKCSFSCECSCVERRTWV